MGESVTGWGEVQARNTGSQTVNVYRLSIAGDMDDLDALEQLLLEFKAEAIARGFDVVLTKLPPQQTLT